MAKKKSEIEESIPVPRVNVFADMEMKELLKEAPITIDEPGDIDWKVSYGEEFIEAEGVVSVPVKLKFRVGNLKNDKISDDLSLADVEINGKSQYGIKFLKPEPVNDDPLAGVDIPRAIAQAQKEHYAD